MNRFGRIRLKYLIEELNQEKRDCFGFGYGGPYTSNQQEYALNLINSSGIRAASKILWVPRRTLQRWCKKRGIKVKRCPDWVFAWAAQRRRRKQFWAERGYC